MNDLDFLVIVEQFRSALLFLLNSSLFWLITGIYFTVGMFKAIARFSLYNFSCETNTKEKKKVWNYEKDS